MRTISNGTILNYFTEALKNLLIFYIAFSFSLQIKKIISLLPQDRHGIENLSDDFSETGYLTVLAAVALTVVLFLFLKNLEKKKDQIFRILIIGLAVLALFLGTIAPATTYYLHNIDTFHHGEQLSPANAFDSGKKPYEDIFFLRGVGEDVIAPWVSFKIFGESVGSYYLMLGLLQLVAASIFFFLLHKLFKSNLQFLFVTSWFLLSAYGMFYSSRDLFTWTALILVLRLILSKSKKPNTYLLFALGGLTALSIFFAFDRGFFLHALTALVSLILILFNRSNKAYVFDKQGALKRVRLLMPLLAGYSAVILIVGFLLGAKGFLAFISTTLEASKYQGIIFNHPIPLIGEGALFTWLPVVVLICITLAIGTLVLQEKKGLSRETMLEVILLLFCIVFLRSAFGRPDSGHIAYGSTVLFILLFYVLFRRLDAMFSNPASIRKLSGTTWPLLALVLLTLTPGLINYYALPAANQRAFSEVKLFLTSPRQPDKLWMTEAVQKTTEYIKSQTNPDDKLFVLSSDPIFYYTTKLENPSRFYISWFADPEPLEAEMLQDLKNTPPKIVIYESGLWDSPDGVPMKNRLPDVSDWLRENYTKETKIDGVLILEKE